MKKIFFIILISFFLIPVFAKSQDSSITHPEHPAEFPGGNKAWIHYLELHLNRELGHTYLTIPKGEKNAKQTVNLFFEIDTEGHTSNIVVENLQEVYPALAKEGIRIIAESPAWKAASQNGKAVTDQRKQKITFAIGSFP